MTDQSRGAHSSPQDPSGSAATPKQRVLNDRYELGALIGRGGMADVWKGRDLLLGRDVAVKILRSDLARDPVFQARFRREAKAVAGLNDPSIVAVYDTGDTDVQVPGEHASLKVPFIVMEYVSGHTLKERLSGGPLPVQDAGNATLGVLAALTSSHAQSIVHRDIKPANVMITDAGAVKVMDFGIARALADSAATMTQTQAVVGTAQYLSPEQARGESVDERSDLYSAGCLLFELLTGRPPFLGDSPVSVAYQHVGEQPPVASTLNPQVTPALDAVLATALAKDREERFQSASDFSTALRQALRGEMPALTQATTVIPAESDDATRIVSAVPAGAAYAAGLPGEPAPTTGRLDTVLGDPEQDGSGFFGDASDPAHVRENSKRKGIIWAVSLVLVALIGVGGFFVWNWMKDEAEKNARVAVPTVASKTVEQASAELTAAGFTDLSQEEVFSDEVPKGQVVETDPGAGVPTLKSTRIIMKVSKGPDTVAIPKNLAGMSVEEVTAALKALGLEVNAKTQEVEGKDIERGKVVNTNPAMGKNAQVGSAVTLLVSKGEVEIPKDIKGMSEDEARTALTQLGFTVAQTSRQVDGGDTVESGKVVSTDPQPGSKQPYGTQVTLLMAKTKLEIPSTLVGQNEASVQSILKDKGFTKVTSVPKESSQPVGTVVEVSPAPGSKVTPDTEIRVFVSNAVLKLVPSVMGQDVATATQTLQAAGFVVRVNQVEVEDGAQGTVAKQSLAPNSEAKPGTEIVLDVIE
ncbi:Stk1 family PASTA domain-containing Ser/Thr kinase [Galactobacter valiniphilus]|uniref:non-specific serine/threonine protein kinase n=1 Tax=Galactobacter valiniphilus TaxID=2676122 RepID=A0A399JCP6_9MICC|nr:Stk1 family PASTA domain-containing Ser/Thr kinase [Galactobacter valiniphilus]RII42327.1 Stk1 family PASTA domain-containing Ser/Thr kinase [Galactobacter valiniphilus]